MPGRAELSLDIRTVPGQMHASMREMVRSFLGDAMEISLIIDVPAVWTDPSDSWILRVFETVAPLLGEMPVPQGATYFTDVSALTPDLGNLPTFILGPGAAAMAHQMDKYCLLLPKIVP